MDTAKCYDCELPYDDFVCDFTIQNKLWKVISPKHDEGGLLCPLCMIKRLKNLGLSSVNVIVDTTELHFLEYLY
jgi:hypothetical protein